MADVRILNKMRRGFTLNVVDVNEKGGRLIRAIPIGPGLAVTVDKGKFDEAAKGNKMLQNLIDMKRLVIVNASGPMTTPQEDELHMRSSEPERPDVLKDTKDAKKGKTEHEIKSVEVVEIDAPAADDKPKGGKRDS